ncbi:MAG TPA: xanthine dehydrogenase [Candidatus Atribacteria bacterium]|jgi:xanthine dehydrogenase accessory factor|nr:xanthine dehydrogenase [Candidatus Atribacteria bacterium]
MLEVLKEALGRINRGETIAWVIVVETKGSTPREVGAKMLVNKDGLIAGTIGGGITEAKVIKEAKQAIKEGKGRVLAYHLTKEEAARDEGAICGGDMKIFIDILQPKEKVLIFGAGHISVYVSKLAKMVGFKVTVIDDREEFANQDRFPEADEIIVEDIERALTHLKITPSTYIIIVTRGHLEDKEVLGSVIRSGAAYIGMIGSRKKNATVFQRLVEQGISKEELDKVHAPIGIDIKAQTPEEIAISIIAEIIQVRRGKINFEEVTDKK